MARRGAHDHTLLLLQEEIGENGALLKKVLTKLTQLKKGIDMANKDIQALRDKIKELQDAQLSAAERERLQDEATELQIQTLQASIDQLNEAKGDDDNQAIMDEVIPQLQGVIDSLNSQKKPEQ